MTTAGEGEWKPAGPDTDARVAAIARFARFDRSADPRRDHRRDDRGSAGVPRRAPVRSGRAGAVKFGVLVHAVRFLIILATTSIVPMFGITGFWQGLAANVACSIFAAALVTHQGLWGSSGFFTVIRSPLAVLALLPFVIEAVLWTVPGGLRFLEPGLAPWLLTLLLVGFNEEAISRVVVLDRARRSFRPLGATALTGALFGLQHLSALAISDRDVLDISQNVVLSGTYGFALAAYQLRFAWVWPLMLAHAASDFTVIHAGIAAPDPWYVAVHVLFILYGVCLLRTRPRLT